MDSGDSQEPLQTEAQPIISGAWNIQRKSINENDTSELSRNIQ